MKLILLLLAFTLTAQGQIDTIRTIILYSDPNPDDSLFINGKWHHNVITGDRPSYSATAVARIDTVAPHWDMTFVPYVGKVDSQFTTYILSIILKAYSRFEKECWADSTLRWISVPCPENRIGCLVNHGETDYWTHREPTFQGFIQWMRKQR